MNIELLRKICAAPGAPGFEDRIRSTVISEVRDLVDDIHVDPMGNVIAHRKGLEEKRIMLAAHMDEISFVVSHIDEHGFVKFHPLGGFDPKTLTAQRVIIHGREDVIGVMGSKPIHIMKPEERNKAPQIEDFFIDTGMKREAVESLIAIGDPITRERDLVEMGDCVSTKSLDNRISVYVQIEALRRLKGHELPYDLYAVFTVQEEVGLRGAISASHRINPDFGIAIDTTIAFDVPGAQPHEFVTKLGDGAAIKILDGMTICDPRMVRHMKDTAARHAIDWQAEVLPKGGTDTAALQRYGKNGSIAGAVSVPTRHIHQVIEMVHKHDVEHAVQLLEKSILELKKADWNR